MPFAQRQLTMSSMCNGTNRTDQSHDAVMHQHQIRTLSDPQDQTVYHQILTPQMQQHNLYPVEKFLVMKFDAGNKVYRMKWKGYPAPWEQKKNITDEYLRDLHTKYTTTGDRRKGNLDSSNNQTGIKP